MADECLVTGVEDLATARALITTLRDELTKAQRENASLRHQLDVLCQRLFVKKSERVDPRQLQLALEQLANEPGPVTEPIEMDSGDTPVGEHQRRRSTGRRPLPAHLPRRRVEIDVPDADRQCRCGHMKTRMGESVAEKLEYEPASFVVIETVRAKYVCPHCHEGVVEAPAPPQAVEKALAGEGLLAHVVVSKYIDHLPLHRLTGIFARQGVELSRSTLCDWVAEVASALAPIGEQLRREITAATYLQTDDTPVTVLDERGGSYKGRLWTYLDPLGQQVVFDATPTHERDGPETFLAPFVVRSLLREQGLPVPVGARTILARVAAILEDAEVALPDLLRHTVALVVDEIRGLDHRIATIDRQLAKVAAEHPVAQRLQQIPGVGVLTATAMVGAVSHIHAFRRGREFASWLGLTPRESSTGGRRYLGRISKRGDVYLRCLLTHGARAVLLSAQRTSRTAPQRLTRLQAWMVATAARRGHNKTAIAVANKLARIIWVVWHKEVDFQSQPRVTHVA